MLRFIDLETPPNREEDVQIAGLKPLPINRMVRQAGRRKNQSQSFEGKSYNAGQMRFTGKGSQRIQYSPEDVQRLLRSDPQFKKSYEKQVVNGEDSDMTDKYNALFQGHDGTVYGRVRKPYKTGGEVERESMPTKDLNQQTLERQQRTKEVINNWDPIEASAKEDYNRLKGGRRGPIPTPSSGLEMIETVDTPSNPSQSVQQRVFPGV